MSQLEATSRPDWRTPAVIIAAGCVIGFLSFGPRSAMGFFMTPISTTNGWGRDVLALSLSIQNLLWGVAQPFMGGIADRFGSLKVFWAGAVMYALGLVLMTVSTNPWVMHVGSGVLIGLGLGGVSFNLVLAMFGKLLPPEKRSMASGFGTAASSAGQFVYAPLTIFLIDSVGWQSAILLLSLSMVPILVMAMALRTKPQAVASVSAAPQQSFSAAIGEAFRHPSYVLLVLGFFTCGFQLAFITVHLPAYVADLKQPAWVGGWTMALIGLFNIVGSLSAGWLGSRLPRRWMLAVIYFLRSVAILAFLYAPASPATTLIFGAAMGLLWLSTVPPTAGLVTLMFGTSYLAMLYGFAFFSHQVGGFLGAYLGGVLYERTGSYDVVWWLSIVLGVASAIINIPIREKPVERPAPAA